MDPTAARACPSCKADRAIASGTWAPVCASCGARFRSPALAALLSVALPGSGHLYLRRRALGAAELAFGLILLAAALLDLWRVFLTVVNEAAPPADLLRACLPWAVGLTVYSVLDGILTWVVSRRRLVPSS